MGKTREGNMMMCGMTSQHLHIAIMLFVGQHNLRTGLVSHRLFSPFGGGTGLRDHASLSSDSCPTSFPLYFTPKIVFARIPFAVPT